MLNEKRRRLFNDMHASLNQANPDKEAYRPSNGTEGMMFEERWCDHCSLREADDGTCDIFGRAMLFDLDEPKYPKEWRFGPDGQPECSAFQEEQ